MTLRCWGIRRPGINGLLQHGVWRFYIWTAYSIFMLKIKSKQHELQTVWARHQTTTRRRLIIFLFSYALKNLTHVPHSDTFADFFVKNLVSNSCRRKFFLMFPLPGGYTNPPAFLTQVHDMVRDYEIPGELRQYYIITQTERYGGDVSPDPLKSFISTVFRRTFSKLF